MHCTGCGAELTTDLNFCTSCGRSVAGQSEAESNARPNTSSVTSTYLYRMIQIPPTISVRAHEQTGGEASGYLEAVAMEQAAQGWDFYRVDTIGVVTQPGCLASLFGARQTFLEYFVVTFRKLNR